MIVMFGKCLVLGNKEVSAQRKCFSLRNSRLNFHSTKERLEAHHSLATVLDSDWSVALYVIKQQVNIHELVMHYRFYSNSRGNDQRAKWIIDIDIIPVMGRKCHSILMNFLRKIFYFLFFSILTSGTLETMYNVVVIM